jgi:ribosomal protein L11 methyltransferase
MIELFPEGFAETRSRGEVVLTAYTDEAGAERLRARFGEVAAEPVPDGWEDEWKRFHRPVEIGSLWIGPPWAEPTAGLIPIVIDPGRAFGTGAHPTTQLCLELLLGLERGRLVDVGCGSGVIAIAAARLGFSPVTAVDSDEDAIEATRRNAASNGVTVDARTLDVSAEPIPPADVAVANIDLATIGRLRPEAARLVTSGYYPAERPQIPGFRRAERRTRADWAADLFLRQ